MASEERVKRFLRLAGHWPKDTREPRGPEHMAKMKAAWGPYSDPTVALPHEVVVH